MNSKSLSQQKLLVLKGYQLGMLKYNLQLQKAMTAQIAATGTASAVAGKLFSTSNVILLATTVALQLILSN